MTEKEYLKLFKISEGKYIIGIFQDTITVYKQQMRALNIFHSLVKEKVIIPGTEVSVAVIGGGAAGLTFAAAALTANMSVTIFEREAEYLHMQQGCDTRKIHPNLYEWPDDGSTFPIARLPVLSWTYDTASNVAKQIVGGLSDIALQIKASNHRNKDVLFNSRTRDEILSIADLKNESSFKFVIKHQYYEGAVLKKVTTYAHLIIYAVGYGVESNLKESGTPSYWRNDALSQSILTDNHRFFVSGIGDGALVDLCRIKIRNYSYDRMLILLKNDKKKYRTLVEELLQIKKRGIEKTDNRPANFYMSEFKKLTEGKVDYKYFWEQVIPDIVDDNHVILNSRRPDDEILDFDKVSMINAFIVFLLKNGNHFSTLKGNLTFQGNQILVARNVVKDVDQFVIRHGTNMPAVFDKMHLSDSELKRLKELAPGQRSTGYGRNYWTFDSISQCFLEGSVNPDVAVMPYVKRSEFVTPDTRTFCLSAMVSLARTLLRLNKGINFRLSLHRVAKFDELMYFQQITPYQGSKSMSDQGCFGNIYPVIHGIVGQAVVSGLPLLRRNTDKEIFDELQKPLDLNKQHIKTVKPSSYLAIPILAPDISGDLATNLILYIEAEGTVFFDKNESLEAIVSGLHGLISYLELMLKEKVISMNELEFEPQPATNSLTEAVENNKCFGRVDKLAPALFPTKYPFKFEEFYSFDIIYNR
ncbi:MAG: hypothetical protein JWR54_1040 [Mucilaginibacter sp.]|nr:hypothetical protein [Mucilaginibacter sp.]